VKNAAAYLDRPFIVLNGDNVFIEMNFHEAFAFHHKNKAKATIFLTRVENPSAFGVVQSDENQKVQRFVEKPPPGTVTTNWINAGGYILEPEVLEHIPADQHYMFEKGLFPCLLDAGEPVYGYPYRGYWLDMGTLEKYLSLNIDLLQSKTSSPLICDSGRDGIRCGLDVIIHPSAVVTAPAIIDRGCRIGKDACLKGPVVLGQSCFLEEGASIENAVLWDNVHIGANARLNRCIISSNTVIGSQQDITSYAVTPSHTAPLSPQQ
jgi:mannose-1-phosphate guanylyltransferase